jgi:two-component system, chemotaxis family, chemotaxis protein CheY
LARVLIADDATFVRKVVVEMVVAAGHTVVAEAARGDEAVELYDRVRPDIAVIDVNMPGLDGFAAAERIRLSHPTARIVLASVLMSESRIRQAIAITHAAPLQKPFDAAQLAAALQGCGG